MASLQDPDRRAARLRTRFRETVSGNRQVRTRQDAELFLEAIRGQQPPAQCVEVLVSSPHGLEAVANAIRFDLSRSFIFTHTLPFLRYLSDPGVKTLVYGQLLEKVLLVVVNPPIVLNELIKLFDARQIPDDGLYAFAWLAVELVLLPLDVNVDVSAVIKSVSDGQQFLNSQDHATRELGYKLQNVLQIRGSGEQPSGPNGPGGRHDNDFSDFRHIRIYPTPDEFLSNQLPYYQTAREVFETDEEKRPAAHLDNQFRLLREDMLAELREDVKAAFGKKGGRNSFVTCLGGLVPSGIDIEDEATGRYKRCTLLLKCYAGLNFLQNHDSASARKKYLQDQPNLLKHQSFGVLCRGQEVFAFAFVERDIDKLAKSPPVVCLQLTDDHGLRNALLALTLPGKELVQFIMVGTPVFAYEPVLVGLQRMTDVPLFHLLVNPASASNFGSETSARLQLLVERIEKAGQGSRSLCIVLRPATGLTSKVEIDESQLAALLLALKNPVSLIQGPPGTGKSFIGAQIARCFVTAGLRILVLSYTNHALDQFLEDLIKAGIEPSSMVRLGAKNKCTSTTLPLLLSEQKGKYRRSRVAWDLINSLRITLAGSGRELKDAFRKYQHVSVGWADISEYLEFSDEGPHFLDALRVPTANGEWKRAGRRGKQVGPDYLYLRWIKGEDPGIFARELPGSAKAVWDMPRSVREQHAQRWMKSLAEEVLEIIQELSRQVNEMQDKIDVHFSEADVSILLQKSIIGCTTTGAAKYASLIRSAKPDVVLVEEAGEILESHILTALTATVKHLVLIGDHKQLRPKINNYALSVEKGDGFDLNVSLFERLINQGTPYATLHKQHRMTPEISVFARKLTYPDLLDAPQTSDRPQIHGLRDRVVFLNHGKQEDSDNQLRDRRDPSIKESKKNVFEAEMVLRCVKYFGQQGYSSDKIVVLTPYLGQLRVIQDVLRKNNHDPTISEMDKAELIRAGLISEAAASLDRKPLRVSTIDNYQGEESDIVIASLTRSNESGDIGFMAAPERLNVLITRARNCIILIGNMNTFMRSKKGKATWHPFFQLLKERGHLYDGLPVKCEKHPERTAVLKEPIDFDKSCPDGGCTEPCGEPLKCGVHVCRSRCHRVVDHSRAECNQLVEKLCDRQHRTKVRCGKQKDGCSECIQEDREQERRIKRDLQLEEDRRRREEEYTRKLQEIQDELEHQRRVNKYHADEEIRKQTLDQHQSELAALKDAEVKLRERNKRSAELAAQAPERAQAQAEKRTREEPSHASPDEAAWSDDAKSDWEFQKQFEMAQSKPLVELMDKLMDMIGLEEVKKEFLRIKSRVEIDVRRGTSMALGRFSCAMLGNPGTGKTTVARLYAQFLSEIGVIPGTSFKENTGAGLANIGVSGCNKLIEEILNNGGGVLFIDEAYQLTSGNNPGGGAVLDYLLAEVENLRGKVVFILAGYRKQMESFFAHNQGLPSRFPIEMAFADYTDDELLRILELKVNERYNHAMDCEDGLRGLYCRIVARRIGRGRGKEGFGNARAVENALEVIAGRQADRIRQARKNGSKPDDLLFTKEDLIGPEPAGALANCPAWKKLQDLIGLGAVKEAVGSLVDSIQQNYLRELAEQPLIEYSLNKVFLGNPGTGKTTVAKLYGEILVALGLLSKGEVVVKNPSDFVGGALGQSEQQTKGILAATLGKVLVIDEAYGLYGGGGNQGASSDPYKTAVIDTIVAEVQSVPGDDRCVLLLGYKDQMEKMFQNVNPGLIRRFPIASGFVFEDFSDDELRKIFNLKVKSQGYQTTESGTNVAMEILKRARNRPNFGNAGEVDILLNDAKARHQKRFSKGEASSADLLEPLDFDEDCDRAERAETNIRSLFEGTVGCEQTVSLLQGYQDTARTLRALGMDPKQNIPFNFLFRGPPGTGKTTTAKKMGQVFYDMGFLATSEVVECSATDLIGQYVGQTGPKVQQLLDKALGKVLFVDEAYRLAEGHFAKEAMDELVDSVTKERYFKKLIIILAGYEADINRLMSVNSGLTSRFPATVNFKALTADECISLMLQLLTKHKDALKAKGKDLDLTCLERPTEQFRRVLLREFTKLGAQQSWASARDVQELARASFNRVLGDKEGLARGVLVLGESAIVAELQAMWNERESRASSAKPATLDLGDIFQLQNAPNPCSAGPPKTSTALSTTQATARQPEDADDSPGKPQQPVQDAAMCAEIDNGYRSRHAQRDAGVSDEVWEQLQRDRQAEEEREEEYRRLQEAARKATADAREKVVTRLLEEKKRREMEQAAKKKLMEMGACPAGFNWIKQKGGYRCAGGSHWMSDAQLGFKE